MKSELDAELITSLFEKLSSKLEAENITAEMFVVGGAAMSLAYDNRRITRDIDAYFVPASKLRDIILSVGKEANLHPDWLNDAAKGFLPGTDDEATTVFSSEFLTVKVSSPKYLLAMKLYASRTESDFDDAVLLAKHLKLETEAELFDVVTSYYPPERVNVKTKYFIQEIIAYLPQNQHGFTVTTTDPTHNHDRGIAY